MTMMRELAEVAETQLFMKRVIPSALIRDGQVKRVYDELRRVAQTSLTVLILGETGSGKELAAQWVHGSSARAARPMLPFNCACIAEHLLESELFGHERGAFTGAASSRAGLFESADGGTLFLDEVGELSLGAQAKLLRVLEGGEVLRLGSTCPRRVDVRIVAATHRELPTLVSEGRFRQDLYFRLNAAAVRLPPLRERPLDVLPLAEHFAARAAAEMGRPAPRLAPCACAALAAHSWPGNIRELRNVVARAVALSDAPALEARHLPVADASPVDAPAAPPASATPLPPRMLDIRQALRRCEREQILRALAEARGNQTRAAALLGISRRALTNKLNAYAVERPRKRGGA